MNGAVLGFPSGNGRTLSADVLYEPPIAPQPLDLPFDSRDRAVEAYTQTIVPLMGRLVGIARRILGDEAYAWDAVQEALIGLWKTGSLPSDPGTWLTRAVVLRSLHLARTRARRRRHEREACDRRREATNRDDPSRRLDYQELFQVLDDALCSLPPEYREVMLLRAGARMDYAAIAEALGIPIGTVRSRLNRTRAHFRAVLSRHDLLDHDRDDPDTLPDQGRVTFVDGQTRAAWGVPHFARISRTRWMSWTPRYEAPTGARVEPPQRIPLRAGLSRGLRAFRTPLASLLMAAGASGLCGLFLHSQGYVVGVGALAVAALGLAWPWLSLRGVRGVMAFDRSRCREGECIVLRLELRNRLPWSLWGVSVRGGLNPQGGDDCDADGYGGLAVVPGRRVSASTLDFTPAVRGVYPRRPPCIVCGFPFGLWQAARSLEVGAPLLVWPRTFPVAPLPDGAGGHAADGLAVRDRPGNWGDPLGVRAYRRGDPIRRIHWGQTARHGELIVCEVQSSAIPRVQIVLDAHPASHTGSGPDGSREWAIRVAASFAEGWARQGAEIELVLDKSVPTSDRPVKARSAALLDAFARLDPHGGQTLAELLDGPECRRFGRGLRLVVTTDVGLGRLIQVRSPRASERFVVLTAAAFESDEPAHGGAPLPVIPWVTIDGPDRVPACLRRAGMEVLVGC